MARELVVPLIQRQKIGAHGGSPLSFLFIVPCPPSLSKGARLRKNAPAKGSGSFAGALYISNEQPVRVNFTSLFHGCAAGWQFAQQIAFQQWMQHAVSLAFGHRQIGCSAAHLQPPRQKTAIGAFSQKHRPCARGFFSSSAFSQPPIRLSAGIPSRKKATAAADGLPDRPKRSVP